MLESNLSTCGMQDLWYDDQICMYVYLYIISDIFTIMHVVQISICLIAGTVCKVCTKHVLASCLGFPPKQLGSWDCKQILSRELDYVKNVIGEALFTY